ncbi:class II aldolase/adducin family protein [Zavarzinia sp. CC-PAN008]|uniref:class II aldolase/adducin family protein n=1 Tax=Zavarzinia sp. CC-PAN008 TaxID=3243332 RepID=UPI003F742945
MTEHVTIVPKKHLIPPARTEAEAREALAAAYRLFSLYRMTDLIYTHLTARVPDDPDCFLVIDYGMQFDEVTPKNLAKVDKHGNAVDGGACNPAGFTIHSAIYNARPDVNSAMHLHTRAGMAVSTLECGLLPISQFSLQFYNRVAYHDYCGIALDLAEREALARDLGNHDVMILRNHGTLSVGRSVQEAFILLFYLERSCEVQIAAMNSGAKLIIPSPEVCEHTARQYEMGAEALGDLEWAPLLRELDRKMPDWRG